MVAVLLRRLRLRRHGDGQLILLRRRRRRRLIYVVICGGGCCGGGSGSGYGGGGGGGRATVRATSPQRRRLLLSGCYVQCPRVRVAVRDGCWRGDRGPPGGKHVGGGTRTLGTLTQQTQPDDRIKAVPCSRLRAMLFLLGGVAASSRPALHARLVVGC